MSRLDERCASACTAANQTANAILEQQRRLAEEFELTRLHTNCLLEATGRFERILSGVLASVDWRGPQPLAVVSYNGRDVVTDTIGQAMVPVKAGEEVAIAVSARAYESMSASAVLSNSERWTFYLARQAAQ